MELVTERSLKEAISEAKRELQVRERCFDMWVKGGKMTDIDAQDRYDRFASALHYLVVYDEILKKCYKLDGTSVATSAPSLVTSSGESTKKAEPF